MKKDLDLKGHFTNRNVPRNKQEWKSCEWVVNVSVTHFPLLCRWWSRVWGLVTHYKCQWDLSPQPVHLLHRASGPWSRAIHCTDRNTQKKPSSAHPLSLTAPLAFSGVISLSSSPGLFNSSNLRSFSVRALWVCTRCRLQGAFTAAVLLVNWYVTLCPIRAERWCQGMTVK